METINCWRAKAHFGARFQRLQPVLGCTALGPVVRQHPVREVVAEQGSPHAGKQKREEEETRVQPSSSWENLQRFNDVSLEGSTISQLCRTKDQDLNARALEGYLRFKLHYLSILANNLKQLSLKSLQGCVTFRL